jgi:hypothetical protein
VGSERGWKEGRGEVRKEKKGDGLGNAIMIVQSCLVKQTAPVMVPRFILQVWKSVFYN